MSEVYPEAIRGGNKRSLVKQKLKNKNLLVVFVMDGCPHCEAIKPEVEKLKEQTQGNMTVVESSAAPPNITGFPSFAMGNKVISGEKTADEVVSELGMTPTPAMALSMPAASAAPGTPCPVTPPMSGSPRPADVIREELQASGIKRGARRAGKSVRRRKLRHRTLRRYVSL